MTPYIAPGIDLTQPPPANLYSGIDSILRVVTINCGVSLADLKGRSRKREFVNARMIALYIIKSKYPSITVKKLGLIFGRNHATAIHFLKMCRNLSVVDLEFKQLFKACQDAIY